MIAIRNILVATDFSAPSEAALVYGRNFARTFLANLHVLHVVDDVASRVVDLTAAMPNVGHIQMELEADAQLRLHAFLTDDDRQSLSVRAVTSTSASPAQAILSYAKEAEIDLVIIGTHGRTGMARLFMGSVAQQVVRLAPCPVLTVHHPEREFVRPDALECLGSQVPISTARA